MLPRHCRAVVAELARVADWSTWGCVAPIARFAAGYSVRHARRALRLLEDLRIVSTTYRPHVASRYRIDTRRLEHLAATVRERVAEARAARLEAARAEQGDELEGLGDVAGIVRQILGEDQARRLGWSVRRCNRLHRNAGAPELEEWRDNWTTLRPHLEGLAEAPGWLWRAGEHLARVQWARDQVAEAAAERRRLAELAELHPAGELHRFGTRSAWSASTRAAGPRAALASLTDPRRSGAGLLGFLRGWHPLRFDGPHLVVAADNPEALLLALEVFDPAEVAEIAAGPFALTWSN